MPNNAETLNTRIEELMTLVDEDNGKGYRVNISQKGQIISIEGTNTQMLYQIKNVDNVKVVFIRYIHYTNRKELLNLLSFACKWWRNLKPNMVYYKEKDRDNKVGDYLKSLGFEKHKVKNELKPFDCLRDGQDCKCEVDEFYIYGVK